MKRVDKDKMNIHQILSIFQEVLLRVMSHHHLHLGLHHNVKISEECPELLLVGKLVEATIFRMIQWERLESCLMKIFRLQNLIGEVALRKIFMTQLPSKYPIKRMFYIYKIFHTQN